MDNALIATGLSLVVTVLTSLFKTVKLSTKQKNLVASGLSLVAGVATVWLGGVDLTVGNIASTAVAIYGATQIAYQFILRGTKLDEKLLTTHLFGQDPNEIEVVLEVAKELELQVAETAKKTRKTTPKADVAATPKKTTAKKKASASNADTK